MKRWGGLSCMGYVLSFTLMITGSPLLALEGTEAVYDLGRVVVTAPGTEGVEAIGTVQTVTAEEIRERDARTLDEALQLLPGINIRVGGDGIPRIDIRGFKTRHVLLLLNGTPFNASFDGQFDPSLISIENIAEIKLITGQGSVLYGPGGNGGVINIITKKGSAGVHGSMGAEGAEGNSYLVKGAVSGAVGRLDGFASAGTFSREGFVLSDRFSPTAYEDGGLRNNSDMERHNAFANVGYSPSDKTSLGWTFSYLQGNQGKPPVVNADVYNPFAKQLKFERENIAENYSTQMAFSHDLDGPVSFKGWLYFNQLQLLENRYDNASYTTQDKKGAQRSDAMTRIGGVNLQARYDLKEFGSATLGFMSEEDDWQAEGFKQKGSPVVKELVDEQHDFQIHSALFEYDVSPIQHLGVTLGLGMHWQGRENGIHDDYSYLLGAYYDLFEGTRLKASHARKIRFPTLRDLHDLDSGNPDLEPEETLHYELGLEQRLPAKTVVSLTGFHIDAHSFIEQNNITQTNQNFDKYRFRGFEASVENKFLDNLVLRASYTALDARNKGSDSPVDKLQYRPKDKVALEGCYRLKWGTSLYASLVYVGEQVFYDQFGVLKDHLSGFTLVDAKLSQSLVRDTMDIYVGVRNLFDKNYQESYGLPQAGRTIYGGVMYRF